MTKFKSRLKDRPFIVGSTGEGFPEFLGEPRDSFPHGVLVNNPHQSSLAQLTVKCMEYEEENLADYPAILFRNLPAQAAQDFSIIAQGIPWKSLTSEGGTLFRTKIDKNIGMYTSNNDPDEITIDPHNEMSYPGVYPSKVSRVHSKDKSWNCMYCFGQKFDYFRNFIRIKKLDSKFKNPKKSKK